MDNDIIRYILYCPKLSKGEKIYLLAILDLISRDEKITHTSVAGLLTDSISTAKKSFQSLRQKGFISAKQISSKEWEYEVMIEVEPMPEDFQTEIPSYSYLPGETLWIN